MILLLIERRSGAFLEYFSYLKYMRNGGDDIMKETIGNKLKILRKERRLSQQQLADALGVKRATISNYEIDRRTPHLSELQRLAEFYGVGLDHFGVKQTDDVLDLIARAQRIFDNKSIPVEKKEEVYRDNLENGSPNLCLSQKREHLRREFRDEWKRKRHLLSSLKDKLLNMEADEYERYAVHIRQIIEDAEKAGI